MKEHRSFPPHIATSQKYRLQYIFKQNTFLFYLGIPPPCKNYLAKGTPSSALPFHRTKNYWLWYMCEKNMFFSTPPFHRAKVKKTFDSAESHYYA
jgi:hypothetical protein